MIVMVNIKTDSIALMSVNFGYKLVTAFHQYLSLPFLISLKYIVIHRKCNTANYVYSPYTFSHHSKDSVPPGISSLK